VDTWTVEQGAQQIIGLAPGAEPKDEEEAQVYLEILGSLQTHTAAGKGIAYYRNEDLGHYDIGRVVALTYGTPEAQFEPEDFPDGPPKQCPDGLLRDITGGINWRYQLCAVTPPKEG